MRKYSSISPQSTGSLFDLSPDSDADIPMTPPKVVFIGSGSYGVVHRIDANVIEKRMPLFNGSTFMHRNFKEIIFLKSFSAPFIPKILDIRISSTQLFIYENYCGITLDKFAYTLPYIRRLAILPSLISQMARILIWLKRHNIAHMDIKPSNLCIDKEGILHLIDFGLVGPVNKNSAKYTGTTLFGDPFAIDESRKISYEYDMFGMGTSLLAFLNKGQPSEIEWERIQNMYLKDGQDEIYKLLKLSHHCKNLENFNQGIEIFELIRSMIILDENRRIKPFDLYGSQPLRDLRKDYPLWSKERDEIYSPKFSPKVNNPYIEDTLQWLGKITLEINQVHILGLASKLFCKVCEGSSSIKYKTVKLFGICCLYLAAIITETSKISITNCIGVFKNITIEQFINVLLDILVALKWDIFPQTKMSGWDGPKGNPEIIRAYSSINFARLPELLKRKVKVN